MKTDTMLRFSGLAMAPGLGAGHVFIYRDILQREHESYDIDDTEVEDEWSRIEKAIEKTVMDLNKTAQRVGDQLDESLGSVFLAQKEMLQDIDFLADIRSYLTDELVNAEQAVQNIVRQWVRRFAKMDDKILRHRADDVSDFGHRLLRRLEGIQAHQLECLSENRIVVAKRLLPSDTVFLSRKSVRGIVLELGGMASHTAILAREIGIPCAGRVSDVLRVVQQDDQVLVDGDAGEIIVRPSKSDEKHFIRRVEAARQLRAKDRCDAAKIARTGSGSEIRVEANVSCPEDIQAAHEEGADGIGLYRLEGLYLSRDDLPTEENIFDVLSAALKPMSGRPVTLRLLDIGADKNVAFLPRESVANPALGRQGIRVLLCYPDLLRTQIRAFLRLSLNYDIKILVPMVTKTEEMAEVRAVMAREAKNLRIQQLPGLGPMVETPAAALAVKELCKEADLLSIGTNDLTQYTMVADRENPQVADYFAEDHPVMLRLIEMIAREAEDIPISLCGEVAGRSDLLNTFAKAGINCLSVAPSRIPGTKRHVRALA